MSAPTRILNPGRHPTSSAAVLRSARFVEWCPAACIQQQTQPFQFSSSHLSTTRRSISSISSATTNSTNSIPPLPSADTTTRQPNPQTWFNSNFPPLHQNEQGTNPDKPPDDRKVKLGKTLRILQEHLPTLLQTPLPQEVLSPNISLHLFPSTHPHLPTVTGRVAYIAALWSSPIAWNRVPIIGNVKLQILSERMVKQPPVYSVPRRQGAYGEQLVVRWRTVGKAKNWGLPFIGGGGNGNGNATTTATKSGDSKGATGKKEKGGSNAGSDYDSSSSTTEVKAPVGMAEPAGSSSKEFTGLFIFDFDREGRILSHTIEHVQESGQWEKGVGAKVVGLTDWLLGGMKGSDGGDTCPTFSRKETKMSR